MLRFLTLLTLTLAAGCSPATRSAAAQMDGARVVARVNDDSITVGRFNASYVRHLIETGQNDTPQRRYTHLNDLIDSYLLAEAARDHGLEDTDYRAYLDLEIQKIVGGRFFEVAFADSFPDPPEADVLEAFRRTKEQVVLRHLFFRRPDDAEAAYRRLQQGADFAALANEVFETAIYDPEAGNLGVAEYWDLDDAVAEAVWPLEVGAYTEPVRSRYGWHILRLEDRLRNPILTEDEYLRRREDLGLRVRARRFRLEGSRFVRKFMEGLGVEVNTGALHALRETIVRTLAPESEATPPRVALESGEVATIRGDFSAETVLATYVWEGRRRAFTTAEYFTWAGHLPYGEVRHRTAASVGRALRNHVLAQQGFQRGLQDDPIVRDEIEYRAALYLADALRMELRREADADPTEHELQEAYDRLGYRRLEKAEADYWHLTFEALADAENAKNAIQMQEAVPDSFKTFTERRAADLTALDELGIYLQKAPLQTPVVIGTGDGGWHVVRVAERTIVYTSLDAVRNELEEKIRSYVPEVRLLRALRAEADIEIDDALFEQMMKLKASPATKDAADAEG
jgi:parvulin-like peptidyl-prolyl isomerase